MKYWVVVVLGIVVVTALSLVIQRDRGPAADAVPGGVAIVPNGDGANAGDARQESTVRTDPATRPKEQGDAAGSVIAPEPATAEWTPAASQGNPPLTEDERQRRRDEGNARIGAAMTPPGATANGGAAGAVATSEPGPARPRGIPDEDLVPGVDPSSAGVLPGDEAAAERGPLPGEAEPQVPGPLPGEGESPEFGPLPGE